MILDIKIDEPCPCFLACTGSNIVFLLQDAHALCVSGVYLALNVRFFLWTRHIFGKAEECITITCNTILVGSLRSSAKNKTRAAGSMNHDLPFLETGTIEVLSD